MVIEYDDVEAEFFGQRERLEADDAAVNGDDEARALRRERPHRLAIGAIALDDAVGDMDDGLAAAVPQELRQQRGACGAIDVVVAKDGDLLLSPHGVDKPRDRRLHVLQGKRVGHQIAQRRIEIALDLVQPDPSPGQHPRHHVALPADLRNRQRPRLARAIEPGAPRAIEKRALDVEEKARGHERGAPPVSRLANARRSREGEGQGARGPPR